MAQAQTKTSSSETTARAASDLRWLLKRATGRIPRAKRPSLEFAIEVLDRKAKREAAAERRRQRSLDVPGQEMLWKESDDAGRQESA